MNSATPDFIDYICRQCEGSVICHLQDSKIKKFLHNFKVSRVGHINWTILTGLNQFQIAEMNIKQIVKIRNIPDAQES